MTLQKKLKGYIFFLKRRSGFVPKIVVPMPSFGPVAVTSNRLGTNSNLGRGCRRERRRLRKKGGRRE